MGGNGIVLAEGRYTGRLKHVIETNHFIVSITNYISTGCNNILHSHKNPHLCLLYQGLDIECKKNLVPYQRSAGDLYYYRAGENHKTIRTLKDSKNINVEFKSNALKYLTPPFDIDLENKNPTLKLNVIKMLGELLTNDTTSADSLELIGFELLKPDKGAQRHKKPQWVTQLDDYLNDHWANDFSLIELAKAIGVHPITISKNFRKHYSCTYGEYRRMLKIQNSIPLVKNRHISLAQIAYECGFSDQSHFIRNFKKYSSFLPKDFRRL
ncbi:MAG: hypothetical protein Mars2KO_17010 [Maribacter sp.]